MFGRTYAVMFKTMQVVVDTGRTLKYRMNGGPCCYSTDGNALLLLVLLLWICESADQDNNIVMDGCRLETLIVNLNSIFN